MKQQELKLEDYQEWKNQYFVLYASHATAGIGFKRLYVHLNGTFSIESKGQETKLFNNIYSAIEYYNGINL